MQLSKAVCLALNSTGTAGLAVPKSLFFVPRYAGSTFHQLRKVKDGEREGEDGSRTRSEAAFQRMPLLTPPDTAAGRALVIVYPRSSGSGIKACPWLEVICRLAGITDIGVKVRSVPSTCRPPRLTPCQTCWVQMRTPARCATQVAGCPRCLLCKCKHQHLQWHQRSCAASPGLQCSSCRSSRTTPPQQGPDAPV